VIWQSHELTNRLQSVLVIPLTTNLGRADLAGTAMVHASPGEGLPTDSVALAFQMRANASRTEHRPRYEDSQSHRARARRARARHRRGARKDRSPRRSLTRGRGCASGHSYSPASAVCRSFPPVRPARGTSAARRPPRIGDAPSRSPLVAAFWPVDRRGSPRWSSWRNPNGHARAWIANLLAGFSTAPRGLAVDPQVRGAGSSGQHPGFAR